MWMVHDIFYAMFKSKASRLCLCIHVATEAYGEILKTIVSLDSNVHDYINSVME